MSTGLWAPACASEADPPPDPYPPFSGGAPSGGAGGGLPGTGGQPTGTCNPEFCPPVMNGVPCCISANGSCGANYGSGCTTAVGTCNPDFCPPVPGGAPCCQGPNGACGVDYGSGCVPPP